MIDADADAYAVRRDRLIRSFDALENALALPAEVVSRPTEETDSSGTVRIGLDSAGIPDRIVLGGGWRRAVGAERLAAAVEEAAAAAMRTAFAAYSEHLAEAGHLENLERLRAWVDGETEEPPPGVSRHPVEPVRTAADDIASLEKAARRLLEARPHEGVGVAAFGKVTVTVAPDGSLSCAVEPEWVNRRGDGEVADALSVALAAARIELDDRSGRAHR